MTTTLPTFHPVESQEKLFLGVREALKDCKENLTSMLSSYAARKIGRADYSNSWFSMAY